MQIPGQVLNSLFSAVCPARQPAHHTSLVVRLLRGGPLSVSGQVYAHCLACWPTIVDLCLTFAKQLVDSSP